MVQKMVLLNTIGKAKQFCKIVSKYDFAVDLSCGSYAVDAKSILGIFSMNLIQPLKMTIYEDGTAVLPLLSEIQSMVA